MTVLHKNVFFRKRGGVQKYMGNIVPWKIGVLFISLQLRNHSFSCRKKHLYHLVTSRPPFWQLAFWYPLNFATHETEDPFATPHFCRVWHNSRQMCASFLQGTATRAKIFKHVLFFRRSQEGCGGLGGENPAAFPKAGPILQQPFSLPESAQTMAGIAFRAAGKTGRNFPAASKFAGKPFQQGISDSHSLL